MGCALAVFIFAVIMWITGGGGLFIFLALGALMTIAMIDGGEGGGKSSK